MVSLWDLCVCLHAGRAAGRAKMKQVWSAGARARPMGRGSRIPALARGNTRGKNWRWVHALQTHKIGWRPYPAVWNTKCSYLFIFCIFNMLFLRPKINLFFFLTHLTLGCHSMRADLAFKTFTVHWFKKGPEVSFKENTMLADSLFATLHSQASQAQGQTHTLATSPTNKCTCCDREIRLAF